MPIRRPHRKSRHGCKACKQRRVKCDEVRPTCTNCQQRQEVCDWGTDTPFIWAGEGNPPRRRPRGSRKISSNSQEGALPSPDTSFDLLDRLGANGTISSPSPTLDLNQLRLIVQWQADTHRFFARNEETKRIWKVLLVEEALNTPFLMHGILAVSALHLSLSEIEPQKSFWLGIATAHKGQALPQFVQNLQNIDVANAKVMMGLSGLVVAFAFGSALTGVADADLPCLDTLHNVFVLCRGVQQIINAGSSLRSSNFAPMFNPTPPPINYPERAKESLDHLEQLNAALGTGRNHDTATYARMVDELRALSVHTYAQPTCMMLAVGWAIRATPQYLQYMQHREPFSLVILAHYCAFLHIARENYFLQTWGSCVLREIYQLLDPMWRIHITWPVSEIFGESIAL
ncbi:Zn(II)2Cys6 transcription factor [Aspergillus alliaceus]|uniref:Zn(II)2Cys6 transcription factor n=1 Tax=Petromyces alliaceus TaxID=209559 RepID=UPI0012A443F4|nr:uncharacterized protein BDW43DRAFT_282127 [Aspergillus alliaceus]KAB8231703.1 hypothetical protein BDW43DRAFT_282127 [Aspergillus alliaceus]